MVVLLSFHALLLDPPNVPRTIVPQRSGAVWEFIPSSPIYLEYTTYMRRVDVADQLKVFDSCQLRSHK